MRRRSDTPCGERLAKLLADLSAGPDAPREIREGVREADATDESLPETEIVA